MGTALTLWSIRLALLCYAAALSGLLVDGRRCWSAARIFWTLGCLLFVIHVVCAFGFFHDWSHARALAHTAEVSERFTGWRVGAGIYFNYLFLLLWVGDTLIWWIWPERHTRRHRITTVGLHAFLFFMAFNGAVVFASGPTRWTGGAISLLLLLLLVRRGYGKKKEVLDPPAATIPPVPADQNHST